MTKPEEQLCQRCHRACSEPPFCFGCGQIIDENRKYEEYRKYIELLRAEQIQLVHGAKSKLTPRKKGLSDVEDRS